MSNELDNQNDVDDDTKKDYVRIKCKLVITLTHSSISTVKTSSNDHPYIKTTPIIRAAFAGPKLPFHYKMNLNNKTTPLKRPI